MARPRTHDEALRLKLLDRAGELIAEDGPKALSLRKLAADAGTSTTAVYSLFGSKPDLVNALYTEGFRRFGRRMAGTRLTGDPVDDLVALGTAYRASALADPHLYGIMFTKSIAVDLIRHNIRVNSLCPGITRTPLLQAEVDNSLDPALDAELPHRVAQIFLDRVPAQIEPGPDLLVRVTLGSEPDHAQLLRGQAPALRLPSATEQRPRDPWIDEALTSCDPPENIG